VGGERKEVKESEDEDLFGDVKSVRDRLLLLLLVLELGTTSLHIAFVVSDVSSRRAVLNASNGY